MSTRSLNKVMLIGNLTRDPDYKVTDSGAALCTFTIATNKNIRSGDGEKTELTEFHNIVTWGKLADICKDLLSKGVKVYVEGSLSTSSWEGDDGVKRYKTEIRADEVILLVGKNKQDAEITSDDASATKKEKKSKKASNVVKSTEDEEL